MNDGRNDGLNKVLFYWKKVFVGMLDCLLVKILYIFLGLLLKK